MLSQYDSFYLRRNRPNQPSSTVGPQKTFWTPALSSVFDFPPNDSPSPEPFIILMGLKTKLEVSEGSVDLLSVLNKTRKTAPRMLQTSDKIVSSSVAAAIGAEPGHQPSHD